MLTHYIAAGFDPARFWKITPRLYHLEMAGAQMRAEHRRGEIWAGAMLPHMDKPPSLHEFVHGEKDSRAELVKCITAWDKIDAALARKH